MKNRNVKKYWNRMWIGFYEQMLVGCLDEEKRLEIYRKLNKHHIKLSDNALNIQARGQTTVGVAATAPVQPKPSAVVGSN